MIEIKNLTKIYKLSKKQQKEHKTKDTQKKAVDDLSLTVDRGEIFGLLGTNGAGKTTTLRCLATLLKPTSGSISIDGLDVCRDSEKVRAKISFLTNEIKMDPYFTPDYLFSFFGRLRGMDNSLVEARKKELFEYFGITDFKNKKVEELSTGMKQKVSIAVSLVHDPEIIIFDEPTNGLDIITARAVLDYLRMEKEQGKTVIVSTHVMSEAQKLCDRIAIIIDGRLAAMGTLEELEAQSQTSDLEDAFFEFYRQNVKEA